MNLKAIFLLQLFLSLSHGSSKVSPNDINDEKYKILMLLPFASKSHRNVFIPIAEGLADKGHKVCSVYLIYTWKIAPYIFSLLIFRYTVI